MITDLDSLLCHNRNKDKYFTCRNCLHGFSSRVARDNLHVICGVRDSCRAVLPREEERLSFKQHQYCSKIPFVIYADFETISIPLEGNTLLAQKPISYGLYLSSIHPDVIPSRYNTYTGEDAVQVFVKQVVSIYDYLSNAYKEYGKKKVNQGEVPVSSSSRCYMCHSQEGTVVEHDHWTGKYRGMACQSCNTKEGKSAKILPVFFHNGSNYDFHLSITELMRWTSSDPGSPKVKVLAKTREEYISISYGTYYNKIIFLDSYRFLQKGIAGLAKSLVVEDYRILGKYFPKEEELSLLKEKGVYPYEYVSSLATLDEPSLPPREKFFSTLRGEGITEEEYKRAQKVWSLFKCKKLLDYHNLYLKTDVLILADAFEKFRDFFLRNHKIDPCYCYSAPGLTWQCGLRYTNITLDYLTDYDMLLLFEKGIRGGYSGILGSRYAKRTPTNQLLYLDANNLYGWAMSQELPVGDFRWEDTSIGWGIIAGHGEKGRGYVLEVDLIHSHNSFQKTWKYPLAPENKSISLEQLSPYQHMLMQNEGIDGEGAPKLILDMKAKSNYPVHYKLLEYYISLGMIVTKVHRVISFREEKWLEKYISFNTNERTASSSSFEKDLWKLMNNAFYGKTLENIRNRKDITLVKGEEEVVRHASKGTFQDFSILSPDLTTITHKKRSVKFDKPIYLGMCILDYAKLLMYKFYYGIIEKTWPSNEILYHDTDSIVLSIPGVTREKLEEDMLSLQGKYLDTSNYPKDHPLYSEKNNKIPGLFKDELGGKIMNEFIALRSKVYSFTIDGEETKKVKGITKTVIDKKLTFEDYKRSLFQDTVVSRTIHTLTSKNHEMFLIEQEKKALSAFDNKRWIGPDRIHTEPFM